MTPTFLEDHISQIPALLFLQKIGYSYLTPDQAIDFRDSNRNVILDQVLVEQLKKLNHFTYRDQPHTFSEQTFQLALNDIKRFPMNEGPIRVNEKVFDFLTLGTSYEQTIDGNRKSYSFKFIDWHKPENNVYHVTEEFEVGRVGRPDTYRPDVVLFVNGIPLVVIECKRPDLDDDPLSQAISQHLRNQKEDGIPDLYKYSQLLLSVCADRAKYGTVGTKEEFWSVWKEQENVEEKLSQIKNTTLAENEMQSLFGPRFNYVRHFFDELEKSEVAVTDQDRTLYALCRPERLLDLTYRFTLYDAGIKKVARYQQFNAVKKTLDRVKSTVAGRRQGGVIYHTQGSGKSLTMVMMAKSLALTIPDTKILIITDRIDLDGQIWNTFKDCGLEDRLKQATSGKNLLKILKSNRASIITSLIGKFETLLEKEDFHDTSPDIFVLVDESHRSQYGIANEKMQQVLPNACYIGFTGTPLLKAEKNTANKFGGFIDKYTILQAVEDGAVVPLIYEGREAIQDVNQKPLDSFFDKISEPLTEYQRADLKKKFARADQLNEAEQKIQAIAFDIVEHFTENWQGLDGVKAQLTASSKLMAIKFKQFFDQIGRVSTEVLISGPDTREDNTTVYEELDKELVQKFWGNMMKRFGTEEKYNKDLISAFKNSEEPEIIIVVDKLLTGFDAPNNTILYIARSLKEHNLLQAIARVNRLNTAKDYGYVVDYYGVLGNLEEALETYTALEGFEPEDIQGTLSSVKEEIDKLPDLHAQVWDLFKSLPNKLDIEAYELLLAEKKIRQEYYTRMNRYARKLKLALSTHSFYEEVSKEKIDTYNKDARFFAKLRKAVQGRYSDTIDYKQYEKQIQKLIDHHISTDEVIRLTEQVNIFDKEAFEKELEKVESTAARADTIASRTAKHIAEKMDEDPVFYTKFSKMLKQVIEDFHAKRLSDLEYLKKTADIKNSVANYVDHEIPEELRANEPAQAYFRAVNHTFKEKELELSPTVQIQLATKIDEIINENLIVDWKFKDNVINHMSLAIEDYLWALGGEAGFEVTEALLDEVIKTVVEIAKAKY